MKYIQQIILGFTLVLSSRAVASQPLLSNVPYSSLQSLATGKPSEIISYGADPLQYGELWLPQTKTAQTKPLVVFIHGGCWLNAYDIQHSHPASHALAKAGYAVWSLEYRRTGDKGGAWPGTYQDILSGIKHAKKLNHPAINKQQLILMGHSAGGHLAVLAANHFARQNDTTIKGAIGLAAISDLPQYAQGTNSCQTATPKFMGGSYQQKKQQYELANPMTQGFHPATVLIHGDKDNLVPLAQSTNAKQTVEIVKGAGHFDMIHSGSVAWTVILQTLERFGKTGA